MALFFGAVLFIERRKKNITKERIDEIVTNVVTKNNFSDIKNQVMDAIDQIPEFKQNILAYTFLAAHVAQINAIVAMKEVLYELFTEKEE